MSFTKGERLAMQAATLLKQELSLVTKQDLIPLFEELDTDHDGKLTISEMVSASARFGFDRPQAWLAGQPEVLRAMFDFVDRDSDGAVNLEEFIKARSDSRTIATPLCPCVRLRAHSFVIVSS